MTAEDAKLECLKFAFLFTNSDSVFGKKNKTSACYQRIQKIGNKLFTSLLSITLEKFSFTLQ